jgi:hypothetical protein
MSRPLYGYFGHHKCASTWIHSILETICCDAGLEIAYLYAPRNFADDLPRHVAERRIDFVSYVNADADFLKGLPPYRGFHVVRDPRDIVVSGYFSHKNSHPTDDFPELPAHREKLQSVPKDEGLHAEIEFSFTRQVLGEMVKWDYRQPHVLELKQEELTPDPYRGFLKILAHLELLDETHVGMRQRPALYAKLATNVLHWHHPKLVPFRAPLVPFPAERLLGIVHDHRFSNFAGGRKEGQTDEKSHYRKGVAGDWKNHFTPEHVAHFKQVYGDLAERLGYEASADWGVAAQVGAR